jgi:hypothetical protein
MSTPNLPKIVVISDISDLDTPNMVSEAKGIVFTGDPDATAPPVDDTTLHGHADDLQTAHTGRQTNPPTTTANDEKEARDTLIEEYQLDALYVQGVARKVAKAAGDIAAGKQVVARLGFKLKKDASANARTFEVYASGIGFVKIHAPSAAKKASYVWQYGVTKSKGTPPEIDGGKGVVNNQSEVEITNLVSGEIYGFRYAAVKSGEKTTHSDGEDPLIFSDFIYFVVA